MTEELYYVVTPEVGDIDDLTGNKEIDLYSIYNDKPHRVTTLTVSREENSEIVIEDFIWDVAPELFADEHTKRFTLNQL